ncbi:unnamed protein product [Thelazia callipaeda]|uniref:FHA domain-containing protein n=1 Tax=Thelazia callipaeda TaxID=103827 RepID=A0A0N5CNQ9_THECL|nr:unnamed protein product [Thelazia callipaeda]
MRCPYAIFTACSQSYAFDERRFTVPNSEEEAIKIGRAVGRWKPSSENTIFDCKVLSRNHAILWHEEGCFFLKDTKSSNGTFVNNVRLSKSAEESSPRQIYSGDILQFGIEIVETANKITHGCIMTMIRLFDANGHEACPPDTSEIGGYLKTEDSDSIMYPMVDSHQLFQLQHYIREAMYREHALEQKLATLGNILSETKESADLSWQALISEDQLLSRIEMLEGQLALYSKNAFSEKVKEQMNELLEDKNKFELIAKESLRRAQEERCEALQRLVDVEKSLLNAEEESAVLKKRVVELETKLTVAVDANNSLKQHVSQLEEQLKTANSSSCSQGSKNVPDVSTKEQITTVHNEMTDAQFQNLSQGGNRYTMLYLCDRKSVAFGINMAHYESDGDFAALLLCALPLFSALLIIYSIGAVIVSSILNKIKKE